MCETQQAEDDAGRLSISSSGRNSNGGKTTRPSMEAAAIGDSKCSLIAYLIKRKCIPDQCAYKGSNHKGGREKSRKACRRNFRRLGCSCRVSLSAPTKRRAIGRCRWPWLLQQARTNQSSQTRRASYGKWHVCLLVPSNSSGPRMFDNPYVHTYSSPAPRSLHTRTASDRVSSVFANENGLFDVSQSGVP